MNQPEIYMNPVAKKAWLEVLRRPDVVKVGGSLFGQHNKKVQKNCMCAMGALMVAYEEVTGNKIIKDEAISGFLTDGAENALRDWSGLNMVIIGPMMKINGKFDDLAGHNDNGVSFADIANAIEEVINDV